MRPVRGLGWMLVAVFILALSGTSGLCQDASEGTAFVRVSFDRLIPTSYPTFHPRYDRLVSTTYPIIHPGVPQVHITSNLIDSFAQPLLHPYPYGSVSAYSSYGTAVVSVVAVTTPVAQQDKSRLKADHQPQIPKLATPAKISKPAVNAAQGARDR